jgi:hypothetical protein
VERGSVQHGSRLDDEMAEEVAPLTHGAPLESRSREDLEAEPPADGEPTPDALITTAPDPTAPLPLSHDELELRSEIARHLRPSAFPAARDDLLLVADEERASDEVLRLLASLPRDIEFHQVSDVWRALGGEVEHRSTEELELPVRAEIEDDGIDAVEIDAVEIEIDVVALGEATGDAGDVGARDALVSETAPPRVASEPSGAPGCNLVAIAALSTLEAGGAVARAIRRVVPFA